MTDSKKIWFYIAANLAILVPVPGRLAYAVIMLVIFNAQMAVVTLLFHAVHRLRLAGMRNSLLALAAISLSIFQKQLLVIFCPVAALTLGYCVFIPTLVSVIMDFFFLDYEHGARSHLVSKMRGSAFLTVPSLLFFLLRDVAGYGTVTFPGWRHILVFRFPYNPESTGACVFLATIPGSLCLIAGVLVLYIFCAKKLLILTNSPYFVRDGEKEEMN